jgi:hypothetical protein
MRERGVGTQVRAEGLFDGFKGIPGLGKAMESLQKGEVPNVAAVLEELVTLPAFKEPAAIAQGYQMAGSWVLKPEGARKGVIHFLGNHPDHALPSPSVVLAHPHCPHCNPKLYEHSLESPSLWRYESRHIESGDTEPIY